MSTVMNANFISELLLSMVRMATPLLIVALAELFSEKAGMVNIGLDGIMAFGALIGFYASYLTGRPILGILAGAVGGIAINMIYAVCTIELGAEQIVYGMAINIFAPAVASFLYKTLFGISSSLISASVMAELPIPVLSDIPYVGKVLFQHSPIVYLVYLMVPFTFIFFSKTKMGLNYRAVGEYPKAAESLGIHVKRTKYIACMVCGALAGVGGAYLTTCYISTYSDGIVSGRGFIALSAVIFGRWTPQGVLIAALLFGFADALQLRLQVLNANAPYQLLQMIPYLCTLFVLAFLGIKKAGPKANGKPYFKEER